MLGNSRSAFRSAVDVFFAPDDVVGNTTSFASAVDVSFTPKDEEGEDSTAPVLTKDHVLVTRNDSAGEESRALDLFAAVEVRALKFGKH